MAQLLTRETFKDGSLITFMHGGSITFGRILTCLDGGDAHVEISINQNMVILKSVASLVDNGALCFDDELELLGRVNVLSKQVKDLLGRQIRAAQALVSEADAFGKTP